MTAKPFSRHEYGGGVLAVALAGPQDLPAVRALAERTLPEAYGPGFFEGLLEAGPDTFLVAQDVADDVLVGFAVAVRETDAEARLVAIATDPARRRRGVGGRLLHDIEARLRKKGVQRLELEVREDNLEAIRFYRRRAYDIHGAVPMFYQDGAGAVAMSKGI